MYIYIYIYVYVWSPWALGDCLPDRNNIWYVCIYNRCTLSLDGDCARPTSARGSGGSVFASPLASWNCMYALTGPLTSKTPGPI